MNNDSAYNTTIGYLTSTYYNIFPFINIFTEMLNLQ